MKNPCSLDRVERRIGAHEHEWHGGQAGAVGWLHVGAREHVEAAAAIESYAALFDAAGGCRGFGFKQQRCVGSGFKGGHHGGAYAPAAQGGVGAQVLDIVESREVPERDEPGGRMLRDVDAQELRALAGGYFVPWAPLFGRKTCEVERFEGRQFFRLRAAQGNPALFRGNPALFRGNLAQRRRVIFEIYRTYMAYIPFIFN